MPGLGDAVASHATASKYRIGYLILTPAHNNLKEHIKNSNMNETRKPLHATELNNFGKQSILTPSILFLFCCNGLSNNLCPCAFWALEHKQSGSN
eukprot:809050-Amphidinium_carterae.1